MHTGTLPSKTLRETALFLSGQEDRATYGVSVTIDRDLFVPKLLSRKDEVRKLEVERILAEFEEHRVSYTHGEARLIDKHRVRILDAQGRITREVTSEFILIATGSSPFRPEGMPWNERNVEDSDSILNLAEMPESLIVLGAGVIGCEYASMFAALGVRVTLVDRKTELLEFLDRDMSEALRVAFVEMGMEVLLQNGAKAVRCDGGKIVLELNTGGQLYADKLLVAAGRSSNTKGIGLEEVGVELGTRGAVKVDKEYRSSVPNIFAAGDVIGFPALASTSMEQGRLAAQYAFGTCHLPPSEVSDILPYGIYTIPEMSCVGLSEEDAIAKGIPVVVGRGAFADNARAKINGASRGMVKLVFSSTTRKLLGAHAMGALATELVHVGQVMVAFGATVDAAASMVFNYPTLSECFKDAALDALRNASLAHDARASFAPRSKTEPPLSRSHG